jgi:hypothetical protein
MGVNARMLTRADRKFELTDENATTGAIAQSVLATAQPVAMHGQRVDTGQPRPGKFLGPIGWGEVAQRAPDGFLLEQPMFWHEASPIGDVTKTFVVDGRTKFPALRCILAMSVKASAS